VAQDRNCGAAELGTRARRSGSIGGFESLTWASSHRAIRSARTTAACSGAKRGVERAIGSVSLRLNVSIAKAPAHNSPKVLQTGALSPSPAEARWGCGSGRA
jgi:hypothetical protein